MSNRSNLMAKVQELSSLKLDNNLTYSLTINFKNVVRSFEFKKINTIEIENYIQSFIGDINTWNLTITNRKRFNEEDLKRYYFDYDLILTSGGIIVNFNSRFLQLSYCSIKNNSLIDAINLVDFYKEKSKDIHIKLSEVSEIKDI